jgi:hypothetical protein
MTSTPGPRTWVVSGFEERALPAGTLEPARLLLLTDALEDAGCDNTDVLRHLRSEGPHVRGCWLRFVGCQYRRLRLTVVAAAVRRSLADNS